MNCTGKNCIMQYDKVDPATCPCVPYCPNATPPKTNADIIRSMTDEELADYLNTVHFQGILVGTKNIDQFRATFFDWLEWLKEEAKANAN